MTVLSDRERRPARPRRSPVALWRDLMDERRVTARVAYWVAVLSASALAGVLYSAINGDRQSWRGAIYGLCIGGAVMQFQQGVILTGLRRRLHRLPLLVSVVCTEVIYVALVVVGSAVAGTILKLSGTRISSWPEVLIPALVPLLYSLLVSAVLITLTRLRELVGAEAFGNLLLGRYYAPVEEERIFLFIDLVGSTAYAQAHGDLRAQQFLSAIFEALAAPVRRHRGAIDDYIGDMAMVTWRFEAGVGNGRCIACVFAFLDAIEAEAARWRAEFGQVPRFRAALHGGRIVTAEVGLDRHKIAYFGDVANTTGRIEGLCRALDASFLVSGELLDRIPVLPRGVVATPRGHHAVRGRGQQLAVFALQRG